MTSSDELAGLRSLSAEARRLYLAHCLESNICPTCGAATIGRSRYGTGALADGIYCSMKCFSQPPADLFDGPPVAWD